MNKPERRAGTTARALDKGDFCGVLVRLDVEGAKYLFVRLGSDGRVQRLGTTARDILHGTVDPALFRSVVGKISPPLLRWVGQSWSDPSPRGKLCLLVVGFRAIDGRETVMRWEYGSESHEPPAEVLEFVIAVVEATNPWFGEEQVLTRRRAESGAEPSGWRLLPLSPA